jgi:thiol-disulfide isomerase/thioredoxin
VIKHKGDLRKGKVTAVLVLVLVVLTFLFSLSLPPRQEAPKVLPKVSLESLTGKAVQLNTFVEQPMLVNLWATWCGPCLRELPLFMEMAEKYPEVTFLFINQKESPEQVTRFLEEHDLKLEYVLLDTRGELATQFDVFGLPSTFFFDSQGKLVDAHTGEVSSVQLFNALTDLTRP